MTKVTEPEILVSGTALEIPLDLIRVDENLNLRRFGARATKLKELVESIKVNGLINPLTVRELTEEEKAAGTESQQYMLITGFQRVKALRLLQEEGMGVETVPVSLRNGNSNPLHLNLAENLDRNELSPLDEASALKTLVDSGESIKDAVGHFRKSPAWGSLTLKYLELRPDIQKKIHEGKISVRVARTLPVLGEAEQDELIANVENGDGESATSKADKARDKRKGGKTKRGRKTEKGGGLSGKQALSRLEELAVDMKANYELNEKDKAALSVLSDVQKFLAGKLGAQALFKAVVGAV